MNRLLQIEWLKLKHYRPFWILTGMYAVCAILVCSSGMFFLEFVKREGGDFNGIDPTILPIYDFPDVWHNVTWVCFLFKIILAFIVIISIANESNFRTLRQNVIDGLSAKEFLASKLVLLFAVSLAATILLFLIGLVTGLIYSHVQGVEYMFQNLEFLLAYLLGTFTYLTFALLITLILPKAGLVIVGLLMYTLIFEPLLVLFLENYPKLSEFWRIFAQFMPVNAVTDLIHVPFPRYILMEIQDYVSLEETLIAIGWLAFNIGMSYWVLKKKDW
jgi:ABC-type transport system involved in multi-copper enzyme maturation permease subunit